MAAALAAATAGCGGDERAAPGSPEDAARAWVRAVDARDWDRVCELSTPVPDDCPRAVAESFRDWEDPRVERVVTGGGTPRFEISTAETRNRRPAPKGWTAYAPLEILLERTDGGYLAHLEVAVIR
jgi:hypothetical protein